MKANETLQEMSLQEEGNLPRPHWQEARTAVPPKEVECADGTVQRINEIPDTDKAKALADLNPFADAPAIDGTLFDPHERKPIKVRDFPVIR